ncbi:YcxB family protein [Agrobacterium vitis]|uniref:YcxB family protein n=1 Tax=Agrobacterium vitis TaxID=373 RepID=UPI002034C591|nr:YcxB family protein [Agrobacterium vitis]MCM2450465.1 YcxB family protein [Agrobacterium vitis]
MSVQEQVDWDIFDTLTVDCQLTEREVTAGNKLNWKSKFKFKKLSIFYVCYVALIYILMFLIDAKPTYFDLLMVAAAILGIIILVLCIVRFTSQRRAKAYFRATPSSRRPAKVGWDAIGFYSANATSRTFHAWSDFMYWTEDDVVLVLLFAGPLMIPLPKSALTDRQLEELKGHIQTAKLPKAKLFPI